MSDLERERQIELARPFPAKYVQKKGTHDFIAHGIIEQRLVHIFGTTPGTEILREIHDEGVLSGVLMRMTVPGRLPVEEFGEADNPQSKTNGARAKDAASDAYKRCAMRLTVGLHLWCSDHYFLFDKLSEGAQTNGDG